MKNKYQDKHNNNISLLERAELLEHESYKFIDSEYFEGEDTTISTVRLGLNHGTEQNPLYFETLVFSINKAIDGEMNRYRTLDEAIKGHKEMCKLVKHILNSNKN